MNYCDYTAQIINDPSYYGTDCTVEESDRITDRLRELIRNQFEGINVRIWNETIGGKADTLGPEEDVCLRIDEWIAANWTESAVITLLMNEREME